MQPRPYNQLSDLATLQLVIWREARGEPFDGKRGVAHVVRNRTLVAAWWNGHIAGSISRVVLQPYQFSSFNPNDPNSDKWPDDADPSFAECCAAAVPVYLNHDEDNTDGATYYYDASIDWPLAWGNQDLYENTLNVGRLLFWKLKPVPTVDLSAGDL